MLFTRQRDGGTLPSHYNPVASILDKGHHTCLVLGHGKANPRRFLQR